jgi:O-antigen/teichoic acid export membrane protein
MHGYTQRRDAGTPPAGQVADVLKRGLRRVALPIGQFRAHARLPLYRNAYALLLSDTATSALGIVFWFLAAHRFTTEQVGLGSAAISAMVLLSSISQLNLAGAMIRFIPQAGRSVGRFVGGAYASSVIVAAVVSVAFIWGFSAWSPVSRYVRASPTFTLWFIGATMAWGIFVVQDGVLTGLRRSILVPIENILFALAKIVLLPAFALWSLQYGIFASWTIPAALTIVPINYVIFRHLIPRHAAAARDDAGSLVPRQIVTYVAGDFVGFVCSLLSTTLLPILVTQLAGASANAYFYLSWVFAYTLHLISMNMGVSLTVEVARDETKLRSYVYDMLIHNARVVGPLVAIVVLGAPYILGIFGSNYATHGSMLLRLLALGALPNIVNALSIAIARVQRRMVGLVMLRGGLCVIVLSLSCLWLPRWGITGVGIAWCVGQCSLALVVLLTQLRWVFRFEGRWALQGAR